MRYFKDSDNNIYAYDVSQTPKKGLVEITNNEADEIRAEKVQVELAARTPEEKIRDLEYQITQRNIRSALLNDQYAIDHITNIETQIAVLRSS